VLMVPFDFAHIFLLHLKVQQPLRPRAQRWHSTKALAHRHRRAATLVIASSKWILLGASVLPLHRGHRRV
jgi:hypothetical protein